MGQLVNKQELAKIVGRSEPTLTTWQKRGMPIKLEARRGASNQYDTADVIAWMIRQEIEKLTVGEDGTVHDYEAERARLTHHQANKTELEAKVLRGELIPADTVERVQGSMVGAFRSKLLSMPTKTAGKVQHMADIADIEDAIRAEIYEALSELSDYDPSAYGVSIIQEDSESSSAPAEADG